METPRKRSWITASIWEQTKKMDVSPKLLTQRNSGGVVSLQSQETEAEEPRAKRMRIDKVKPRLVVDFSLSILKRIYSFLPLQDGLKLRQTCRRIASSHHIFQYCVLPYPGLFGGTIKHYPENHPCILALRTLFDLSNPKRLRAVLRNKTLSLQITCPFLVDLMKQAKIKGRKRLVVNPTLERCQDCHTFFCSQSEFQSRQCGDCFKSICDTCSVFALTCKDCGKAQCEECNTDFESPHLIAFCDTCEEFYCRECRFPSGALACDQCIRQECDQCGGNQMLDCCDAVLCADCKADVCQECDAILCKCNGMQDCQLCTCKLCTACSKIQVMECGCNGMVCVGCGCCGMMRGKTSKE